MTPIVFQNDTFYTIKIGELIFNKGIDMQDHFTIHNLPYTYPHWLYDLIIYLIYNTGVCHLTFYIKCIKVLFLGLFLLHYIKFYFIIIVGR